MDNDLKNGFVDLHVHTTFSDGTFSPEEVVGKALEIGFRAIAITDHDCVEGIAPAMDAAKGTALEIIPGVEVSADKDTSDIHILGYFVDWQDPCLLETLESVRQSRVERMKKMLSLLKGEGIDIDGDSILEKEKGTIGRLKLAWLMKEKDIVKDVKEAFDRYIGQDRPCYVRYNRLSYIEAISMIKKAGGVPVLAHPSIMGKDEYLPSYVEAGIRGIEAHYIKRGKTTHKRYFNMADEYGLIVTGGSDCHGDGKGEMLMGKIKLSYDIVEELRKESEKIRSI